MDASLLRPVSTVSAKTLWPIRCQLGGELERWQARITPWVPPFDGDFSGVMDVRAELAASAEKVDVQSSSIHIQQLVANTQGLHIDEPIVRVEATGSWDQLQQRLACQWATLVSTSMSFRADDLRVGLSPSDSSISGKMAFRGDVARLWRWMEAPNDPQLQRPAGALTGRLTFTHDAGATSFEGRALVDNAELSVRDPAGHSAAAVRPANAGGTWKSMWQERQIGLSGQGSYGHGDDRLRLGALSVTSDTSRLDGRGEIRQLTSLPWANISGEIQYDLASLTERFRHLIGDQIRAEGQETRPFVVRGPLTSFSPGTDSATQVAAMPSLVPRELTAQTSVGWSAANVYGVPIGPSDLQAQLTDGTILVSPLDLRVSSGRLRLAPSVTLNSTPMMAVLEPGRVAEGVHLTPQMCRQWMKYVAPMLADATHAEGTFSLDLSDARIPLTEPTRGDIAGILSIHGARIGPGPLASQFLSIAQQVQAVIQRNPTPDGLLNPSAEWLTVADQGVEFRMVDGRVHHQGLTVNVKDVVIRTRGWVAMDESISLVAEVPILDRWVERDRILAGLRGQVLEIPIRGTLSRPQVDSRAITQLGGKLLSGSAQQLLQGEVQKQLQRLFGPGN